MKPDDFPLPLEVSRRVAPLVREGERWNISMPLAATGDQAIYHPGLLLSRHCPKAEVLSKENAKGKYLGAIARVSGSQQAALSSVARAALLRREELVQAKEQAGMGRADFTGQLTRRMVVGIGNSNPLETALTLHPTYGITVIPGSALKGVTRHWRLMHIASKIGVYTLDTLQLEQYQKDRKKTPIEWLEAALTSHGKAQALAVEQVELAAQKMRQEVVAFLGKEPDTPFVPLTPDDWEENYAKPFRAVFGSEGDSKEIGNKRNQGKVTFLMALPVRWLYWVDVLTPHYGEYYQGKELPSDWLSPNPVPFLTVNKGSQFRFDVLGETDELAHLAIDWLRTTLIESGVGAKTRGGFGRFSAI